MRSKAGPVAETLDRGRESFGRQAWGDAFALLSAADRASPLAAEDLERLATAAYLTGRDEDCAVAGARAHHEFLRRGSLERAVRCAFWLAFSFFNRGEVARGSGWVARGPGCSAWLRATPRRQPPPSTRRPRSASASATRTWSRSPGSVLVGP